MFVFRNPAAPKKRRLRKLGETADATVVPPVVDEPQNAAAPPAGERREEERPRAAAHPPLAALRLVSGLPKLAEPPLLWRRRVLEDKQAEDPSRGFSEAEC